MSIEKESPATRAYAAAYEAQYGGRNPLEALRGYGELPEAHPDAPEADYARSQIRNIVTSVVPAPELLVALQGLALRRLQASGGDVAPTDRS